MEASICELKLWKLTLDKLTFCQVGREGADSHWGVRISEVCHQAHNTGFFTHGAAAAGHTAQGLTERAAFYYSSTNKAALAFFSFVDFHKIHFKLYYWICFKICNKNARSLKCKTLKGLRHGWMVSW